jgi:hypothetical protein
MPFCICGDFPTIVISSISNYTCDGTSTTNGTQTVNPGFVCVIVYCCTSAAEICLNSSPYSNCLHHHRSNVHAHYHYHWTESEQHMRDLMMKPSPCSKTVGIIHPITWHRYTQEQRRQLRCCESLKNPVNSSYFTSFYTTHTNPTGYRGSYTATDCNASSTQLAYKSSYKCGQIVSICSKDTAEWSWWISQLLEKIFKPHSTRLDHNAGFKKFEL